MQQAEPEIRSRRQTPIAIIGMAARFADAGDVATFWRNLENGVESLQTFSNDELLAEGIDPDLLKDPRYVRKGSVLEGYDLFDAAFFGVPPSEARWMDPQHRLLLECSWHALEDAGYAGESRCRTGVYAGCGGNTYFLRNVLRAGLDRDAEKLYHAVLANDRDFLATRISYKLGLNGPSMSIQSACSTGIVLVDTACHALERGDCDLALAAAASVNVPQKAGYLFVEGMNVSSDGHCRPFDAAADGFRTSSGAAVVVLKRLSEALRDRDTIRAVVLGSAVTNDGAEKPGFTAPGLQGQTRAAAEALSRAGVDPESVAYVEAQGSGTRLGDAVEVAALQVAFGSSRGQVCAIGSVKGNLGNLVTTSGLAGLIKAVLALEHKRIPPTLNFTAANPLIDFSATPFFVNIDLRPWPGTGNPRRAAVHSYGIGGTNAHLILQEAPEPARSPSHWPCQLMVLSAKTVRALGGAALRLQQWLRDRPLLDLADVCFTLQTGRARFPYRWFRVCGGVQEAMEALASVASAPDGSTLQPANRTEVAFFFPAQPDTLAPQSAELYSCVPAFRAAVDACVEAAPGLPGKANVFAVQLALARTWISWGVLPKAVAGEGTGQSVADVILGKLDMRDALNRISTERPDCSPPQGWQGFAGSPFEDSGYGVLEIGTDTSARNVLERAGKLWLSGVPLDWGNLHAGEARGRVPLPGYSFDSRRYWIQSGSAADGDAVVHTGRERRPSDLNSAYTKPETEEERWLQAVWEDLLGIEGIGIDDDFYDLGGNSLLATSVLARVRDHHHVSLELPRFEGAATIRQIASAIAALRWALPSEHMGDEPVEREEIFL